MTLIFIVTTYHRLGGGGARTLRNAIRSLDQQPLQMNDTELALLDCVPTPIFVLELSNAGDVTYAFFNKAALNTSKFVLDDYIGRNAKHLYHGEYGEFVYEKHTQCFRAAEPSTYDLLLPLNGKLRSIRTSLQPILDSDGLVVRVIGASTDVSAENELETIRNDSRSIEKELQEFIYLAAHDLRSPMMKVQMFADMLRDAIEDPDDENLALIDLLEKVSVESMTMIKTVLSHAEITGAEESIEHMCLSDIFTSIVATLDPTRLHEYRIDDCTIHGDRTLIHAILRNLTDNAFKHNAPIPITLDVLARNTKAGYFAITLSDNGQGMHIPENLFNSTDTGRSHSGFGLLAIRKLIKRAGGDIVAQHSANSTGLSVTATLPGTVIQL